MAKTFSYQRQDVVQALPVKYFKERWPALFEPTQLNENKFRRITTVSLESTFMQKLDKYTPKPLDLFKSKGGAVKADIPIMFFKITFLLLHTSISACTSSSAHLSLQC
ncbi:unnamed protein product [Oncorhynchus mykiss]|uniref:Uncharacterized protein n=1 Tax=Oncorhynchus mykiss TaxID=8022 RepID=A0A060XMU8_ONCMY|nr:unnamed protein product [Oncorhynchus mykiss]